MLRGVGRVEVCWRMSGNSVGGWSLREGVERVGDKGCCMLRGGPSFPMHFVPCPWSPWAMGGGSVVFVDAGLAGCQSVQEGVHSGGERG